MVQWYKKNLNLCSGRQGSVQYGDQGPGFSKGAETFRARRQILKSKPFEQ